MKGMIVEMETKNFCQDKYIYLDWNVIKNIINPRNNQQELDEEMKRIIFELKKKYKIPYSHAHIKDRASRYNEKYRKEVEEDLGFVEKISDALCLGRSDDLQSFVMVHKNVIDFFDDEIKNTQNEEKFPYQNILDLTGPFNVDMDKINMDHPLYEMLNENDGRFTLTSLDIFFEKFYDEIFSDADKYKKFRMYMEQFQLNKEKARSQQASLKERDYLDFLLMHMWPFMESMEYNIPKLKTRWKDIAESWFTMHHGNISLDMCLILGYVLLDFHPQFHDKLKKNKNTLDNIVRDGNHAYFASEAKYFVSEDRHTREKTHFLYDVYGIKTKVMSEDEFVRIFS